MEMLPKTAERLFVEQMLAKALRVIKRTNPVAYSRLDQSDFDDLADGFCKMHMAKGLGRGKRVLEEAFSDFEFHVMQEPNVNIGTFSSMAYKAKARRDEDDRMEGLLNPKTKASSEEIRKFYMAQIRENLKNAIKPLPYDKNRRI